MADKIATAVLELTTDNAKLIKGINESVAAGMKLGDSFKSIGTSLESVNRIANGFLGGGAIANAQNYALAVKKVGDVSKLTADEQRQVNAAVAEGIAKYKALGVEAPAHLVALEAATRKLADTTGAGTGIIGTATGRVLEYAAGYATGKLSVEAFLGAGEKVFGFLEESVGQYLEAEQGQRKMVAALQAQGTATPAVIDQYDALSKSFERTTVFSNALIKEMATLFTQVGDVGPDQMKLALSAATDLASGLGIDLRSATLLVAKSFEDNFAALKKAGVTIDETRAKSEGMSYVLGEIERRFGGQAQADVASYAGQIKQLGNEWHNFQEETGKAILDTGVLQIALAYLSANLKDQIRDVGLLNSVWTVYNALTGNGLGAPTKPAAPPKDTRSVDEIFTSNQQAQAKQITLENYRRAFEGLAKAQKDQAEAAKKAEEAQQKLNEQIQAAADVLTGKALAREVSLLAAEFQRAGGYGALTGDQLRTLSAHLVELEDHGAHLGPVFQQMADDERRQQQDIKAAAEQTKNWAAEIEALNKQGAEMDNWAPKISYDIQKFLNTFGTKIDPKALGQSIGTDLGDSLSKSLGKTLESIPGTVARAFEGGGGAAGAAHSLFAQLGGRIGQDIGGAIAKGLGANLAAGTGSGLGLLAGGLASGGIGLAIGGIGALFSKLLNDHGRGKVEDFAKGFGGFDALHKHLEELGDDGAQLWIQLTQQTTSNADATKTINAITQAFKDQGKAIAATAQAAKDAAAAQEASNLTALGFPDQAALQKTADGLRATYDNAVRSGKYTTDQLAVAWKRVQDATNAALGITATDYQTLIALGQQYGLTLADMGKGVQFGNFSDQVSKLIGDYKTLTGAGADHVFANFEGKFQELFLQAQQFGVAIPEALKPYLQQMVNLGDLVDSAGNKVKDLSTIDFSATAIDTAQQAEDQAALAAATVETSQAFGSATDALTAKGGLNEALLEAARLAGDLGGVLSSWQSPGSVTRAGVPLLDTPLMKVTSAGLALLRPGDIGGGGLAGMPALSSYLPVSARGAGASATSGAVDFSDLAPRPVVVNNDLRGAYFRSRQDIRDLTNDIANELPAVLARKGWRK